MLDYLENIQLTPANNIPAYYSVGIMAYGYVGTHLTIFLLRNVNSMLSLLGVGAIFHYVGFVLSRGQNGHIVGRTGVDSHPIIRHYFQCLSFVNTIYVQILY